MGLKLVELLEWIDEEYTKAEQMGITVLVEGIPYYPYKRERFLNVLEESVYMKDYIDDERGNIVQINFNKITSY